MIFARKRLTHTAMLFASAMLLVLVLPMPASAQQDAVEEEPATTVPVVREQPTPFDQGRIRLSLLVGGGSYGGSGFFAIGAGVGYFIFKGFELSAEVNQWFGSNPNITQLSPALRYVFYQVPVVHPYIGFFYRHWFTWDGFPDADTIGGRAGLYFVRMKNFAFGLGVGYEHVISSCNTNCDSVYPEVALMFSF